MSGTQIGAFSISKRNVLCLQFFQRKVFVPDSILVHPDYPHPVLVFRPDLVPHGGGHHDLQVLVPPAAVAVAVTAEHLVNLQDWGESKKLNWGEASPILFRKGMSLRGN